MALANEAWQMEIVGVQDEPPGRIPKRAQKSFFYNYARKKLISVDLNQNLLSRKRLNQFAEKNEKKFVGFFLFLEKNDKKTF